MAGMSVMYPHEDVRLGDALDFEGAHCSPDEGCITCGDVAVPLTALLVDGERGLALCRDAQGQRETVEIALVGPVSAGDELLVHAGTAIAHLGLTDQFGKEGSS
ncbi:MAG: HypC/HybG/HupF family hydrogenase formation chaperone [Solirubrobacterales bacterium]|nr:HypC/HybG/HupF family hydrogenase formation chaperone [Solirubrobacterales bacterium]